MNVPVLPTTNVYAQGGLVPSDPHFGLGGGSYEMDVTRFLAGQGIHPTPIFAEHAIAGGGGVVLECSRNDPLNVMDAFFKGLSQRPGDFVIGQLELQAKISRWSAANYGNFRLPPYAVAPGRGFDAVNLAGTVVQQRVQYPPSAPDFYGTPLMPLAGIYYWVRGGGQTRYVHLGSLGLELVVTDFPAITAIINDLGNGPGTYPINANFEYNTFDRGVINVWAAGLLGRVNGHVQGSLTIDPAGAWSFDGSYTLNPDRYDAPKSNRTAFQEGLTTFLRGLGDSFGYQDYNIEFLDSLPLHFDGHR